MLQGARGSLRAGHGHESPGQRGSREALLRVGRHRQLHPQPGCMLIKEGDRRARSSASTRHPGGANGFVKSPNNAAVPSTWTVSNAHGDRLLRRSWRSPTRLRFLHDAEAGVAAPVHDRQPRAVRDRSAQHRFLNMKMNNIDVCQAFLERLYDPLPDYLRPCTHRHVRTTVSLGTPRGEAVDFLKSSHTTMRQEHRQGASRHQHVQGGRLARIRHGVRAQSVTIAKGRCKRPTRSS